MNLPAFPPSLVLAAGLLLTCLAGPAAVAAEGKVLPNLTSSPSEKRDLHTLPPDAARSLRQPTHAGSKGTKAGRGTRSIRATKATKGATFSKAGARKQVKAHRGSRPAPGPGAPGAAGGKGRLAPVPAKPGQ